MARLVRLCLGIHQLAAAASVPEMPAAHAAAADVREEESRRQLMRVGGVKLSDEEEEVMRAGVYWDAIKEAREHMQKPNVKNCASGSCMAVAGQQAARNAAGRTAELSRAAETEARLKEKEKPNRNVTGRVYFDLAITRPPFDPGPNEELGRITIDLFGTHAPQSVANFMAFCVGHVGPSGKELKYAGLPFYEVAPHARLEGGDWDKMDGTGKLVSIYNGAGFKPATAASSDLSSIVNRETHLPGAVSLLARGGLVGSKFNIALDNFKFMQQEKERQGGGVLIGHVVNGMNSLKKASEAAGTEDGTPRRRLIIAGSGVVEGIDLSASSKGGHIEESKGEKPRIEESKGEKPRMPDELDNGAFDDMIG